MGEAKRRRQAMKLHRLTEQTLLLSDSVDPLDEAYATALRQVEAQLGQEVASGQQPPGLFITKVLHDDWCPKLKDSRHVCRCTPEVRVERAQP